MAENQVAKKPSKQSSLLRSSLLIAMLTGLSRLFGLARDVIIAVCFGSRSEVDAFLIAFKIPNFMRRLFAEGAFSQAFVPVLSHYAISESHSAVKEFINRAAGTLILVLTGVTVVGIAAAPAFILLFAPGFHGEDGRFELAVDLLRITFPYLMLISLTALAGAVLNSYGKFAVPAFTPVLLNLSLIGAVILLSPQLQQPVMALALGVLVAGIVQLLLQIGALARLDMVPRPVWGGRHEGVQRVLKLMAPSLFAVSVSQINLLIDTSLASFLAQGSISWLYYSDRLMELPLGIFGVAISTAILPNLSRHHAGGKEGAFARTLDWSVRQVLLIGLPASLALALLAEALLATLFGYGRMTGHDVTMAGLSLRSYAAGLIFFMSIKVLAPGFFARQDTRTPVRIAVWAMFANMVFNAVLVWPLAHAGLALATSLSAAFNAGLLFRGLWRQNVFQPQPGWPLYGLRLLLANAVMVTVLMVLLPPVHSWLNWSLAERLQHLLVLVAAGGGSYVLTLIGTGLRLHHLRQ